MDVITPQQILHFWFESISPSQWWEKDPLFDQLIQDKFGHIHHQATQQQLEPWRGSATGALAEIIILDQFSRNIFRDQPEAFMHDDLALTLAKSAIAKGWDQELPITQRKFLYMPFMHSESLEVHEQALQLFAQPGMEEALEYEKQHMAIIKRFGRYPHRNKILGRVSSDEEVAFLKEPNSSF